MDKRPQRIDKRVQRMDRCSAYLFAGRLLSLQENAALGLQDDAPHGQEDAAHGQEDAAHGQEDTHTHTHTHTSMAYLKLHARTHA